MNWLKGTAFHQIRNGAKPGDIPFYQPNKFQLVINTKAAKALGLEISPNCLGGRRGDRIEWGLLRSKSLLWHETDMAPTPLCTSAFEAIYGVTDKVLTMTSSEVLMATQAPDPTGLRRAVK